MRRPLAGASHAVEWEGGYGGGSVAVMSDKGTLIRKAEVHLKAERTEGAAFSLFNSPSFI